MTRIRANDGEPDRRGSLSGVALALCACCLVLTVPVTFGALAGIVEPGYAVPGLAVGVGVGTLALGGTR